MKCHDSQGRGTFSLQWWALFVLFSPFATVQAEERLSVEKTDDYPATVGRLIQANSPRSCNGVILITQNGKTKYSKAAGDADIEKRIALKPDDNFRIMSNSKQIITTSKSTSGKS